MDPEMKKYLNIIIEGLNRVEEPYYHIKTTYALSGIVRERAFCYELYYQIRCIQTERNEMQLSLNGEIDKRGHLEFDKDDQKNPDFVFHIPGKMGGNTFVVEVKGRTDTTSYIDECVKDFDTLELFVSKYGYKMGIFVLYNHTFKEFTSKLGEKLREEFSSVPETRAKDILIICKKDAYTKPELHTLSNIIHY